MKKTQTKKILNEVLLKINPDEKQIFEINFMLKKFLENLKVQIKKNRLNIQVFVGGSFAKGTVMKRKEYDIDIFLRFDKKYKNEEISDATEKLLKSFCICQRIHGSRDYFKVKQNDYSVFEVVPVKKISNPKNYENVTDLSYFHVSYIKRKIRNKKILGDIKLAKAFCHACGVYGAESYVRGFSGYALELLIYEYGGFEKFVRMMADSSKQIILNKEKQFKNRKEILMNLNEAKLKSPIILVDPTYQYRNVTAALSDESFKKFRGHCKKFLRNPSEKYFESEKIDVEKIQKLALEKKLEFLKIRIETEKQEGNIAGAKLLKFYNYLKKELSKRFEIKKEKFIYDGESQFAEAYFVLKRREYILYSGPSLNQTEFVEKFKKNHKTTFQKSGRIFANEKFNLDAKEFAESWKKINESRIKEMAVSGFYIL